jgi:hypothetical protein
MNKTEVIGKWSEQIGKLKERIEILKENDLRFEVGKEEEMYGKLVVNMTQTREESPEGPQQIIL